MPPVRNHAAGQRRSPQGTRSALRRARASIPSDIDGTDRSSVDGGVMFALMVTTAYGVYSNGLDFTRDYIAGLKEKNQRGEAVDAGQDHLVPDPVVSGVMDPFAPSDSAADSEVATLTEARRTVTLHRSDTPTPPPAVPAWIDITGDAPVDAWAALVPNGEISAASPTSAPLPSSPMPSSPRYSPYSPVYSPTRYEHPEYNPTDVPDSDTPDLGDLPTLATTYAGPMAHAMMGPLARGDVYGDVDSRDSFFDHLKEMVLKGFEPLQAMISILDPRLIQTKPLVVDLALGLLRLALFICYYSGSPVLIMIVLFMAPIVQAAPCPTCSNCLPGCTFSTTGTPCPFTRTVAANVAVVAGGVGALNIAGLLKPRFMRLFSKVAFETVLALVRRKEPGTTVVIDIDTKVPEILLAVSNGLLTMDNAVLRLCELIEDAASDADRAKLTRRLDNLKSACDIRHKANDTAASGLFEAGVLTFMWAKVSEFVMTKDMQVKLVSDFKEDGTSAPVGSSRTGGAAKIKRPSDSFEFAEMMNLFGMYLHALGVSNWLELSDFYEHVVYDTTRLRGETWQFAHELMLVIFRRIEDSGGKLTLGNAYHEVYLNALMVEARANAAQFFRSPGGNPGRVNDPSERDGKTKWNKKFSTNAAGACRFFNAGLEHPKEALLPDGTCKYNHVCDHWVSNKGKKGRCVDPGHARDKCTNPHKCDACVN